MGPDDIELGSKPIRVQRQKKCGVVISARFTSEDADLLDDLAEQRDIGLPHLVRQIVREYLTKASVVSITTDYFRREPSTMGNAVNIQLN